MRKLMTSLCFVVAVPWMASGVSGPVTITNETGLTYNNTYPQNLQQYGSAQGVATKLSATVQFSSVTFPNQTFSDGSQSTGFLTVVSTAALVGTTASDSITVPSTAAILGSPATNQITINSTTGLAGTPASFTASLSNFSGIINSSQVVALNGQQFFTYGGNWASTDTIQHAALNLASAIQATGIYTAAVTNSTGVIISMVSSGTFANGFSVNSASPAYVSTGTMTGGTNPVTIGINTGTENLQYTYGGNWASTDTVTHAAVTLSNAISSEPSDLIVGSSNNGIVFASATAVGTAANAFTVTTSSSFIVSISSSNFSGGLQRALNAASFTINGKRYINGKEWFDTSNTSTGTALTIATFINSISTNGAVPGNGLENIVATQAGAVINLKTVTNGIANNAITLAVNPASGSLAAGSPTFLGGQDNASITINGTKLTLGTDFNPPLVASTTANLASSISTAINANSTLNKIIKTSATGAVVVSTSVGVGLVNYTTVSSTQSQLSFSGATMTGGTTAAFNLNSGVISLPNHGFTKALQVLYSGTPAIGGLTTGTTYFVVVVDANDIGLSSTSAVAQTGNFIVITSTNTQLTKDTYTLAPLTFSQGSASGKWQVSNDGITYNDYLVTAGNISVSSQTFTPVFPSTMTIQDFGIIDYGWLRYNAIAPTQGAVQLKVILNAKD